jgi:CRP-like cAMP-binding protein
MSEIDGHNDIPREEKEKFAKYLYKYGYGDVIIREGQSDTSLYLLRTGSVGVFKDLMGEQKQIATIQAVNIFGEIAPITESPRTATVWVTSNEAVIYKFNALDRKIIYTNPAWAELLITRLCVDVREANNRNVALQAETARSIRRNVEIARHCEQLISALISLQNQVATIAVMNSKEWQYLTGLRDMILAYVEKYLPEIYSFSGTEGSENAVDKIIDKGLMPETLLNLLRK